MLLFRRYTARLLILLWAGYTALSQPGIPPCWLEARACELHPHFGARHAGSPHSHEYLFDQSMATTALGLPALLIPASLLIELLFLSPLLRSPMSPACRERSWLAPLEPPPPRPAFSS
jgi:hypothetical protein